MDKSGTGVNHFVTIPLLRGAIRNKKATGSVKTAQKITIGERMMIGGARRPEVTASRASRLQLTPMSGLVLGLVVSTGIWACAAEVAHLAGLF
jgi:hypothetical protein